MIFVETKPGGEIMGQDELRHGMGFKMRLVEGRWLLAAFEPVVDE